MAAKKCLKVEALLLLRYTAVSNIFPAEDFCSTMEDQDIRVRAIGLLSRREHSLKELQQKLLAKGADPDALKPVLEWVVAENYQSDQRYCEMLVRNRCDAGYGMMRIRQELSVKGIDRELAGEVLESLQPDWCDIAYQQLLKRFGENWQVGHDARKVQAFLARRGFDSSQVKVAMHRQQDW
ncbi:regulatory protein RecX [Pelagibaculum spongiae]|uniref:Regulatory protein RecX n=1 Tax=Pelagibaculum spongiae TaxID=2080658 RepID=A0A2V1H122_9GAMM|nr:regulatory protein RecX [Pelagibaculum spongiae]PVZ69783.1 recombination regulator RecX [Pelagibaculum spongiae]